MDKEHALCLIKKIQNGGWDRNFPKPPTGAIAEDLYDNSTFSIGMEYGAIVVLMQIYDISKEDIEKNEQRFPIRNSKRSK